MRKPETHLAFRCVPICALGPGRASWCDNVTVRRDEMRPCVAPGTPENFRGAETTNSTIHNLLDVSQPLLLPTPDTSSVPLRTSLPPLAQALQLSTPNPHRSPSTRPHLRTFCLDSYNSMCAGCLCTVA